MSKRLAIALILVFLIADSVIRVPAIMNKAYFYGNLYALILITGIPIAMTRGFSRALSISICYMMVINLIDNLYFNPVSFQLNDLLLLPAILVPLAYKTIAKGKIKPTDVILMLILPVYLLTRNAVVLDSGKYLFSIGDATIFLLVAVYAGYKLRVSHTGIAFMFFALCLGNFVDNTVGDPYHLTMSELIAACVVVGCSLLYELQQLLTNLPLRRSES